MRGSHLKLHSAQVPVLTCASQSSDTQEIIRQLSDGCSREDRLDDEKKEALHKLLVETLRTAIQKADCFFDKVLSSRLLTKWFVRLSARTARPLPPRVDAIAYIPCIQFTADTGRARGNPCWHRWNCETPKGRVAHPQTGVLDEKHRLQLRGESYVREVASFPFASA